MNNEDTTVEIDEVSDLFEQMGKRTLWVEWTVKNGIGPDWITPEQKITFYLDQIPLAETAFREKLKSALIVALNLPEPDIRGDAVIRGEGEFKRIDAMLELSYEWDETVPYMWSRDSGVGTIILDLQ